MSKRKSRAQRLMDIFMEVTDIGELAILVDIAVSLGRAKMKPANQKPAKVKVVKNIGEAS